MIRTNLAVITLNGVNFSGNLLNLPRYIDFNIRDIKKMVWIGGFFGQLCW